MKKTKTNQKTKVDNDHGHVEPRVEAAVVESRGKQSEMFRLSCGETDWSSTAEDWNWSHYVGLVGWKRWGVVGEKVVWSSGDGVVASGGVTQGILSTWSGLVMYVFWSDEQRYIQNINGRMAP